MRITSAALIIAVVIFIGFVISVPHTREVPAPEDAAPTAASIGPSVVTLKDTYTKGVHTISGSLLLPNPCTILTSDAELVGTASTTEIIVITLTAAVDTGVCLQVPTQATFSATVTAPADLPISVLFNGETASTTLK